jgi:hypothetical protein
MKTLNCPTQSKVWHYNTVHTGQYGQYLQFFKENLWPCPHGPLCTGIVISLQMELHCH